LHAQESELQHAMLRRQELKMSAQVEYGCRWHLLQQVLMQVQTKRAIVAVYGDTSLHLLGLLAVDVVQALCLAELVNLRGR